eukprot:364119-Chlamydomonas_euryale.AAC.6
MDAEWNGSSPIGVEPFHSAIPPTLVHTPSNPGVLKPNLIVKLTQCRQRRFWTSISVLIGPSSMEAWPHDSCTTAAHTWAPLWVSVGQARPT